MPAPTRPTASATIATDWGQAVHDATFAPKGCKVRGAEVSVSTTPEQLPLDEALSDPGGFLDEPTNSLIIPSGADGLYQLIARGRGDESSAVIRIYAYLNGAETTRGSSEGDGSNAVPINLQDMFELVAGDQITFWAERIGSSSDPNVRITEAFLIRVGYEFGA